MEFLTTVTKLPSVEYPEQLAPPQPRRLVDRFEAAFFRLGSFTADRPAPVIIGCLIFTAIGCAGLPFMKTENNAIKLWIPQTSDFSLNYAWLWSHFPPELRQVASLTTPSLFPPSTPSFSTHTMCSLLKAYRR